MIQGQIKEHQYMVNVWRRSESNGTLCLWRGNNRDEWIKQIRKALDEYPVRPKYCRTVRSLDRTVFSIATESGVGAWQLLPIWPPKEVIYGIPEEATRR